MPGSETEPGGTGATPGVIGPDGQPIGPEGTPNGSGTVDVDDGTGPILNDPSTEGTGPVTLEPGDPIEVPELPEAADPVTSTDVFLGSRVRRLSNIEYRNTIRHLFGVEVDMAQLPNDSRQNDFTRNINQAVDPVLGGHLQRVAKEVAATVVAGGLSSYVSCADTSADAACAQTFIEEVGAQVYRRPLDGAEVQALLALYTQGGEGESNPFQSGIEIAVRAMLQSASFLYVSEIGSAQAAPGDLTLLNSWELASSLAYLMTAHPPDAELLAAASDGSILEPSVREAHATRLLQSDAAKEQIQRFVKQWLKIDRVATLDKADERFGSLRAPLEAETDALIADVAFNGDGRLSTMLTAGYTFIGPELEDFYGITADATGRADLTGTARLGLLQHGSFLAANSQPDQSGPVLRGVAVLRKIACVRLPSPAESDDPEVQMVMPPPPDPSLSTRERFAQHSDNTKCASCHALIDPIGFSFENFGPIGNERATDGGENKAVDTSGGLNIGSTQDGPVADSVELSRKLAADPRVAECFARQLYRYGAATAVPPAEATFIRSLGDSTAITDNVKTLLVELVSSNSFLLRTVPTAAEQL